MIGSSSLGRAARVVAAFALVAGFGIRAAGADTKELKGKPAPDFTLKTANDKVVTLSKLTGNVVVVDFWATWCPPCRASLPHLQALSADKEKYDNGLRVLAVNAREGKDKIEPFMLKNKYTFAVPMDADGKAMGEYGVKGIPTTVVIGRDGVVRAVFIGFNPQDAGKAVENAVDAALREK